MCPTRIQIIYLTNPETSTKEKAGGNQEKTLQISKPNISFLKQITRSKIPGSRQFIYSFIRPEVSAVRTWVPSCD